MYINWLVMWDGMSLEDRVKSIEELNQNLKDDEVIKGLFKSNEANSETVEVKFKKLLKYVSTDKVGRCLNRLDKEFSIELSMKKV